MMYARLLFASVAAVTGSTGCGTTAAPSSTAVATWHDSSSASPAARSDAARTPASALPAAAPTTTPPLPPAPTPTTTTTTTTPTANARPKVRIDQCSIIVELICDTPKSDPARDELIVMFADSCPTSGTTDAAKLAELHRRVKGC